MSKVQVKGQVLPAWVEFELRFRVGIRDALIYELSELKWTYHAIAQGSGLSRERVRQIVSRIKGVECDFVRTGIDLPFPPSIPEVIRKTRTVPSAAILERLKELQPLAQKVRSNSPRYRKEAEEYTALINHVHKVEKVPLARLAKSLGVTHSALRFRLTRYGYMVSAGSSGVYRPVIGKNRYGRS